MPQNVVVKDWYDHPFFRIAGVVLLIGTPLVCGLYGLAVVFAILVIAAFIMYNLSFIM